MPYRPEAHLIPNDIWQNMIRYGVTPSMNLVIENERGEVLFLLRRNEPVKGLLWMPGSRIRNGETNARAIERIASEELGIGSDVYEVIHVSDRFNEEIYPMAEMSDPHEALQRYGPDVKTVHYWGAVSYLKLRPGKEADLTLDSQSERFEWCSQMPKNPHPYLVWYFQVLWEAGFDVLTTGRR